MASRALCCYSFVFVVEREREIVGRERLNNLLRERLNNLLAERRERERLSSLLRERLVGETGREGGRERDGRVREQ